MAMFKGIIAHWAVTNYKADATSKKHYHFIYEGDGHEVKGDLSPDANAHPIKKGKRYAAHTLNCNSGFIGVSCAAMSGALSETNYGKFPITKIQFEAMCKGMARLCKLYGIPVTPRTVLSHAEVQGTLGIKQRGKWDIATLPHWGLRGAKPCGDAMRRHVAAYMAGVAPPEGMQPKPVAPSKPLGGPPVAVPQSKPLSPSPAPETSPSPRKSETSKQPAPSAPRKQGFWASIWASCAGALGFGVYAGESNMANSEALIVGGLLVLAILIVCYLVFWPKGKG